MKSSLWNASVCALFFVVGVPAAVADPFPLTAANCGGVLDTVGAIGRVTKSRGDRLEVRSTARNGILVLEMRRLNGDGTSVAYRMETSQTGLLEFMTGQKEDVIQKSRKHPVVMPTMDGAIVLPPDRLDWIRTGIDFVKGEKLERTSGIFGYGATYYSRDPLKSEELPEVLGEVMRDACAYETKVAADLRAMKEMVGRLKGWGKEIWSNFAPNSKVATQVQRKVAEVPAPIGSPKKSVQKSKDAPATTTTVNAVGPSSAIPRHVFR